MMKKKRKKEKILTIQTICSNTYRDQTREIWRDCARIRIIQDSPAEVEDEDEEVIRGHSIRLAHFYERETKFHKSKVRIV